MTHFFKKILLICPFFLIGYEVHSAIVFSHLSFFNMTTASFLFHLLLFPNANNIHIFDMFLNSCKSQKTNKQLLIRVKQKIALVSYIYSS